MNEEAFKKGFIKRAKECGLTDKHAEELVKEAFFPALLAAGRMALPWLARGATSALPWLSKTFSNARSSIGNFILKRPMLESSVKALGSDTAHGVGYGMMLGGAMNQLGAPQAQPPASPQLEEPQQNWVNPFTSHMNRNTM